MTLFSRFVFKHLEKSPFATAWAVARTSSPFGLRTISTITNGTPSRSKSIDKKHVWRWMDCPQPIPKIKQHSDTYVYHRTWPSALQWRIAMDTSAAFVPFKWTDKWSTWNLWLCKECTEYRPTVSANVRAILAWMEVDATNDGRPTIVIAHSHPSADRSVRQRSERDWKRIRWLNTHSPLKVSIKNRLRWGY